MMNVLKQLIDFCDAGRLGIIILNDIIILHDFTQINGLFFSIWCFQTLCKVHFVPALEFHYCSVFIPCASQCLPENTVRIFQGRSIILTAVGPEQF